MKVLVCGSPSYSFLDSHKSKSVGEELDAIHKSRGISLIMGGGGPGASDLAAMWANTNGVPYLVVGPSREDREMGRRGGDPARLFCTVVGEPDLMLFVPWNDAPCGALEIARAADIETLELAA